MILTRKHSYQAWKHAAGSLCAKGLLAFSLSFSLSLTAHEYIRPKNVKELMAADKVETYEDAVQVLGTELAWADFDLIRRDFPFLKDRTDAEISKWILENFSYVGAFQKSLNGIRNSPIPTGPLTKPAIRPSGWGRSAVMQVSDPTSGHWAEGMMDIKGIGHGAQTVGLINEQVSEKLSIEKNADVSSRQTLMDALRSQDHSDGLMSFGEAIAEVTRQKAAQTLFDVKGLNFETVENYAIIRLPFNILKEKGKSIPAALLLRQAHIGRYTDLDVPPNIYVDDFGKNQNTFTRTAVDFGGVLITDPRIADRFAAERDENGKYDPQKSLPWKYGHETAEGFVKGAKNAVYEHIAMMLAPLDQLKNNNRRYKRKIQRRALLEEKKEQARKGGASVQEQSLILLQIGQARRARLLANRFSHQQALDYIDQGNYSDALRSIAHATVDERRLFLERIDWKKVELTSYIYSFLNISEGPIKAGHFNVLNNAIKNENLATYAINLLYETAKNAVRITDPEIIQIALQKMKAREFKLAFLVDSPEVQHSFLKEAKTGIMFSIEYLASRNVKEAYPLLIEFIKKGGGQRVFNGFIKCNCEPPLEIIEAIYTEDKFSGIRLAILNQSPEAKALLRKWHDSFSSVNFEDAVLKAQTYMGLSDNCLTALEAQAAAAGAGGTP